MKRLVFAVTIALAAIGACAQEAVPTGLWRTIDDDSGKPKALVRISENNGELTGRIEKLFEEPGKAPNPTCTKCEGTRKDQPIIGMTILFGMRRDGAEYDGGQILDPNNGKIYRSKLSVTDGGKKLNVRGYIGIPMLGRTQTWLREE
jgi:uncharacterized protein (DUF2147 family)